MSARCRIIVIEQTAKSLTHVLLAEPRLEPARDVTLLHDGQVQLGGVNDVMVGQVKALVPDHRNLVHVEAELHRATCHNNNQTVTSMADNNWTCH